MSGNDWIDGHDRRSLLMEALAAEAAAGHWDRVEHLLEKESGWQVTDVAGLTGLTTVNGDSVASWIARWFLRKGWGEKARRLLQARIDEAPGDDAAYEVLVERADEGTGAFLDAVAATDAFEERPLIWKAVLALRGGNPAEAETLARRAIAIDPSDGEQKHGKRMRVYGVLADALEKKGDADQAAFFRNVVRAIRLSEEGDRFHEAGLIRESLDRYRQSLGIFGDAYCIQSRLARELAQQGKADEALVHYRRAFELMPDSFGRVESHCFGCEKAFEGVKAQSVAEEVFLRMAAERPDKPQIFYMLGYLRYEQARYAEAAVQFRKAVDLDPDYLNAWQKLREVGGKTALPEAEREAILFRLIRLDPSGRHIRLYTEKLSDLAGLWRVAREVEPRLSPVADQGPIHPLGAERPESVRKTWFHDGGRPNRTAWDIMKKAELVAQVNNHLRSLDPRNKEDEWSD